MKLSRMLLIAAVGSLGLAAWSFATFPIIKFSTESMVNGRLLELIDRSQLSEDELKSLDLVLKFLIGNDRQWQMSQDKLHAIATFGFTACAIAYVCGAAWAHSLEKQTAIIAEGKPMARMHS